VCVCVDVDQRASPNGLVLETSVGARVCTRVVLCPVGKNRRKKDFSSDFFQQEFPPIFSGWARD